MEKLNQIIKNHIESDELYALQIDGEWGTGKTYFIKNSIINKLEEEGDFPGYFSVYGYDDFDTMKRELFYSIAEKLSEDSKMFKTIQSVRDKSNKILDVFDDGKLKPAGLIANLISESYETRLLEEGVKNKIIVLFLDDLERISDKISLKDFLGFVLNEILEKMKCRVIITSNSNEISQNISFKKVKEKVINRTVHFSYDLSTVETIILKENRNKFISKYSEWIVKILENHLINFEKSGLNLRTLFSVISNFDFVENHLRIEIEKLPSETLKVDIRKSIFLNVFVITNEYKLGNIANNNSTLLKKLCNGKFFNYYLGDGESKKISENIIDKYHNAVSDFDDYIIYSNDINFYILFGYFEDTGYVNYWKKEFIKSPKSIDSLDKLYEFRRCTDEELTKIQESIILEIKNDEYDFYVLIRVLGQLVQFENMGLLFVESNYLKVVEEKLIQQYREMDSMVRIDLRDEFFMKGLTNYEEILPNLFNSLKVVSEDKKTENTERLLDALFNKESNVVIEINQSTVSSSINIFKAINSKDYIKNYLLCVNNKADLLDFYIRSEYLQVINSKQFHSEEIDDVKELLEKISSGCQSQKYQRIDLFKLKQLNETLSKLIKHLS